MFIGDIYKAKFINTPKSLQLIRLTWWTRNSKKERVDLEDLWATSPTSAPSHPASNPDQNIEKPRWWRRVGMWLCGLSEAPKPDLSREEQLALEKKLTSIEEESLWRNVCNVNAIILLTANVFLWGFFA